MNKKLDVYRPTINEAEMNSLIYDLDIASTHKELQYDTKIILGKLKALMLKANRGIIKPVYIQTGRNNASASISLESLGADVMPPIVDNNPVATMDMISSVNVTEEELEECGYIKANYFIEHGINKNPIEFIEQARINLINNTSGEY